MEIILPIYLIFSLFVGILFLFASKILLKNGLSDDNLNLPILIVGALLFFIFALNLTALWLRV